MYDEKTAPSSDDWPPYDHNISTEIKRQHARDNSISTFPYAASMSDQATNDERISQLSKNRQFDTGAQRDTAEGKLRMSLLPQQELKRVMKRYLDGADKYGENNWMKGMPVSAYYDCASRHLEAWWAGEEGEDHAAAVVWNMLCAMWTETNIKSDLNDREQYPCK